MLRVMLQKLWHKKWMVVCLLLGCILLTATVVSFPLYRNAAFNRMLQDEFNNDMEERGTWPAINTMFFTATKDPGGQAMSRLENFARDMYGRLGVKEKETTIYYTLTQYDAKSTFDRGNEGDFQLSLSFMSRIEEHAKILSGEMLSASGRAEDGTVEVIISEATMTKQNLLVGETVEFKDIEDADGKPFRIRIAGVFAEEDKKDLYWQVRPESMENICIMKEDLFKEYFAGESAEKYTLYCYYYSLFDYTKLRATEVQHLFDETNSLLGGGSYRYVLKKPTYTQVLESYLAKGKRIEATLFILQIPVLILLAAFLMMISGQMYDMERNEISVIKSRGASGLQIFRLYLYQSIFLAAIGVVGGIPLGVLFCKLLGSADNFLMFNFSRELTIEFTKETMLYTAAAFVGALLIMTIPAIPHSRVSIVKLKQQKAAKKYSFWEKCFLDVIFLGISLYGYYSYSSNPNAMAERVLKGEPMDPLLYFSSSLFILGAGMLMIRLQPLLVKLIYQIGKRWWKPASYSSFMEIIKNGRKQQFIMIFMVLTISLGMFNATVARTILQNARENQQYLDGADYVVREVWKTNAHTASNNTDGEFKLQYYEPDYSKYAALDSAKSYTKVIFDTQANFDYKASAAGQAKKTPITLLGIHTREFGEITNLSDSLLKQPYHQYLNDLALRSDGVLVSSNFQSDFGLKLEDEITFHDMDDNVQSARIVGFFDHWPGYQPSTTSLNNEGAVVTTQNYWVVANIGALQQRWGLTPYQVWVNAKKGANTNDFYKWLKDQNVSVKMYQDRQKNMDSVTTDPLLQGTNGILTMSFIVTIILCAVGYLIYWIMSIRSRELIFGVLRACGLHKAEIFHMLIIEQIFSGIFSIFAGIGIGKLSSDMFVPMLQNAYAGSNQVLPMRLITDVTDLIRLYGVTAAVMVVCLTVLTILVFKLNITKALKLGEE